MTHSSAVAAGEGTIELFVRIDGTQYVLGTSTDAPTGNAWYDDNGFSYLQGLRRDPLRVGCRARPGEVWPQIGTFDIEFEDKDETLGQYLKNIKALNLTTLTDSLDEGDSSIAAASTSGFSTNGVAYVDKEAISYIGKNATTFGTVGSTRGHFGSRDTDHIFDANFVPACVPEVADGPGEDLSGRRVVVYAAERVNGALSSTEQRWVGVISGPTEFQPFLVRLPVTHPLEVFAKGTAFSWVPSGRLRGIYVANVEGWRAGRVNLATRTGSTWTHTPVDVVADGTVELFETYEDLIEAVQTEVHAASADFNFRLESFGRCSAQYNGAADEAAITDLVNPPSGEGAMWLCGFTQESGGVRGTGRLLSGGAWAIAADAPATVYASTTERTAPPYERRLYLHSGEAQYFRESYARIETDDGGSYGAVRIDEVNTVSDYLVVGDSSIDATGDAWPGCVVLRSINAVKWPTVRQAWYLKDLEIHEAIRILWSGEMYAGAPALPYTPPAEWRPSVALHDDDVDWDALKDLVSPLPGALRKIRKLLDGPTEVSEFLTGIMLAAGLYAVVDNEGKATFLKARLPAYGDLETTIDGSYIDGDRCTEVQTDSADDRPLNLIEFTLEDTQGREAFANAQKVLVVNRQSIQRYGIHLARDMADPAAALSKRASSFNLFLDTSELSSLRAIEEALGEHVVNGIMGLLSEPRPTVRLPVAPKASSFEIGDGGYLTTVWVRDPLTGRYGVTGFPVMVAGWERQLGHNSPDYLTLILVCEVTGMIAPSALATSYDAPSTTLTFADTEIYKLDGDTTDLDYFEAGDEVEGEEHDDETPGTFTAEVQSLSAAHPNGTMTLTNIVGSVVTPCVIRFNTYSNCDADQTGEGWIWIGDDADGLIEDLVAAERIGL